MIKLLELYRNWGLEKKIAGIGFGLILLFLLYLFISGQIESRQLANHGRYFIAEIVKIGRAKNGAHYYIRYKYNDIAYNSSFKPDFGFKPNRVGAFVFIRLLPANPKVHRWLDLGEVPDSLREALPKEGWEAIPGFE